MSELRTLLSLELKSFYGINQFRYSKDPKFRKKYKAMSIIWIMLIAMIFSYVGGLVFGLCSLGLSKAVPAYLTTISSATIIFFGIFSAGTRIFGEKGYDILTAMPLRPSSIVLSRFIGHYLADLALTVAIMLPGYAVYGYCNRPSVIFYAGALVSSVFVPAIPLVIASALGSVVTAVSSRMKNKSMAGTLLIVIVVVGIMLLSFSMDGLTAEMTEEQFANLANMLNDAIGKVYPPAAWVGSALCDGNVLSLALFAIISIAVATLCLLIISKYFHRIVRGLRNFSARHDYELGKLSRRSALKALYFKEAKRYFSSSIYVTNTIIGPIMGTVMSIALLVVGADAITESIPLEFDLISVIPFAFSAIFTMMTTASVSVSMEGKQFWIVKSLPVSAKALLDSKILLNLSLMAPFYCISQILLAVALKPSVAQLLGMLIIPASLMVFAVVLGITVNLKLHSFDWDREEAVVKQSSASFIGGFAGLFISVLSGVAVLFTPSNFGILMKSAICLILWIATVLLYKYNNKVNLIDLE